MPELKNETFINNITDPITGKQVKKIYQIKLSKLDRILEPMVWEYYRNRANMSVAEVYKKYNGYKLKMIFFNDPVIHTIDNGSNGIVKYGRKHLLEMHEKKMKELSEKQKEEENNKLTEEQK